MSYVLNQETGVSNRDLDKQVKQAYQRHKADDIDHAYEVYSNVLRQKPDHAKALHYMGLIAQKMGHAEQAAKLIFRSIGIDGSDALAYDHLGQIYMYQKDYEGAAIYIKTALEMEPENPDFLNNYGNCLKYLGDVAGAVLMYKKVLDYSPETPISTCNLANALKTQKDYDQAIVWFRKTITIDSGHIAARHNLGVSLEQKGDFDEAVREYLEVLRLQPNHVPALSDLLSIKSFSPDGGIIDQAETMFNAPDMKDPALVKLGSGLGKYYDRAGKYDRAFHCFTKAKQVKRQSNKPFDIKAVSDHIDKIIEVYTPDYFTQIPSPRKDSSRPVFIVGMPRSGTTLTEQILASHPQIFGAGELDVIPKMAKEFEDYPFNMATLSADETGEIADRYLSHIEKFAPQEALRVTDKLPFNFMNIGLIATLFPKARVVHCLRDPLDIGLSCLIEIFNMDQDFTTELEDFGLYYLQYVRLMDHWRKTLPQAFHEQYYENLIGDQEKHSRALVAHCGLEWHDDCLNFQNTDRAVMTPSRWQVRQSIYTSSSGRWKNYAAHMEPLRRILDENNFKYGQRQ